MTTAGDDIVGINFAYAIREQLRRSAAFDLVAKADDSSLQLRVISFDLALPGERPGMSSAVAVTATMTNFLPLDEKDPQTWYPIYLKTKLMTVGSKVIDEQATSVLAMLDKELQAYRAALK